MINDSELMRAISNIMLRSEKQTDVDKLIKSFVDVGIIAQIDNSNNQIVFGRRGTGKTHILKYLQRKWEDSKDIVTYTDVRTLSSTSTCIGNDKAGHHAIVGIFKDVLSEIQNTILGYVTDPESKVGEDVIAKLNEFSDAIVAITKIPIKHKSSESAVSGSSIDTSAGITLAAANPSVGIKESGQKTTQESYSEDMEYVITESLPFQLVHKTLNALLSSAHIKRYYLIIDEWAILPGEIQTGLAECLKRTILPINIVTTKICSIEYRSEFYKQTQKLRGIGFELGSDVQASLNLDDYYVYDKNPEGIEHFFASLIFKHLESELPHGYLTKIGISDAESLPSKLFSEKKTFVELVRASEGVARDCINILTTAYFDSLQRSSSKIDMRGISEGALKWYEKDKSSSLSIKHKEALKRIITEVIGGKKARTFLVTRDDSRNPIIQELFDLRILHLITKGYADKSNPGVRYDVFTLDYGTYVDLIKTKSAPEVEMKLVEDAGADEDRIVPFDDKRSIRRIILDTDILKDLE